MEAGIVPLDITGERYGRLVALRRGSNFGRRTRWLFRCDCGIEKEINLEPVRSGFQKSCGCLRIDTIRQRSLKHGHAVNYKGSAELKAWQHAKSRCFNKNDKKFPIYGGRGITMCAEWRDDATAFLRDMGPRPKGMTLDRIDVNGNYEPKNCRWATPAQQSSNRRMTLLVQTEKGTVPMVQFAREVGISYKRLWAAIRRGENPIEAAARIRLSV